MKVKRTLDESVLFISAIVSTVPICSDVHRNMDARPYLWPESQVPLRATFHSHRSKAGLARVISRHGSIIASRPENERERGMSGSDTRRGATVARVYLYRVIS